MDQALPHANLHQPFRSTWTAGRNSNPVCHDNPSGCIHNKPSSLTRVCRIGVKGSREIIHYGDDGFHSLLTGCLPYVLCEDAIVTHIDSCIDLKVEETDNF